VSHRDRTASNARSEAGHRPAGRVSEELPILVDVWEVREKLPWSARSIHASWIGEACLAEGRLAAPTELYTALEMTH
jgi:hypothetical protein